MFLPTSMAKSPLIVPGAESAGLVAPSMTRPVATAPMPSQTIQHTGPEHMYCRSNNEGSTDLEYIQSMGLVSFSC